MAVNAKENFNKTIWKIEDLAADDSLNSQDISEKITDLNNLTLRDMATVFKYLTGGTLLEYIKLRKMMASYLFLINGETRNISGAVGKSGLSDQPSYTKAFKSIFGLTPKEAYLKKDPKLFREPLTWDALSLEDISLFPVKEHPAELKSSRFGIEEAKLSKAAEAMNLEAFYDFSPLMSQYAFDLAEKTGKPMKETFRFVDSFREMVEPTKEPDEDPYAGAEPALTQKELLHKYGDSEFYQRMFFERGIVASTIDFLMEFHNASEDDLLECNPEMLDVFCDIENAYGMSFGYFMQGWRSYMDYTGGKYDSEQFESFVELLDSWVPIEDALEGMEWSDEEYEELLYDSADPRVAHLDDYYDEIDQLLTDTYTRWDGGPIDIESDMDND